MSCTHLVEHTKQLKLQFLMTSIKQNYTAFLTASSGTFFFQKLFATTEAKRCSSHSNLKFVCRALQLNFSNDVRQFGRYCCLWQMGFTKEYRIKCKNHTRSKAYTKNAFCRNQTNFRILHGY